MSNSQAQTSASKSRARSYTVKDTPASVEPEKTDQPSQTTEKPKRKPSKHAELIRRIKEAGTLFDARDVYATYALVNNPKDLRGIWRLAGTRTVRLTNCYAKVLRYVKPLPTSSNRDFSVTLQFTNPHDQVLEITLTRDDIDADVLASQFLGYGSLPETTLQKQFLLEALKELMRVDGVLQQYQADSLGWYTLDNGSKVWLLANGVETLDGFKPVEQSPFLSPRFLSPGNGYHGETVNATAEQIDQVMSLLLNDLLPSGKPLLAALLGLAARIMLPIPNDDTPGMLRFASEIIGPSRHGKSRTVNAFLSLFGTRFEYDKGTLLADVAGTGDTKIGRLGLSSYMRYTLFADFDHKVSPGHVMFEKVHKTRADTNNIYADDIGGGTVGTQHGSLRTRSKPTGALIRTSNYNHAEYSLTHNEESIEARVCSFLWPVDQTSDTGYQRASDEVSHKIEDVRLFIYGLGSSYRRWIMRHDATAWSSLLEIALHVAREKVYPQTWCYDLHRNQAVELVLGLLMFRTFLVDVYPSSFMVNWIDEQVDQVIADRVSHSLYIATKAGKHSEKHQAVDFTLSTLRQLFTSKSAYVLSQQNKQLLNSDTDYSLEWFGYRRASNEKFDATSVGIGYLVHAGQHIAFNDLLFDALKQAGDKAHVTLPDKDELNKLLVDQGIAIASHDGRPTQLVKINKHPKRCLVIPISTIYPQETVTDGENIDEDDIEPSVLKEATAIIDQADF